MAGLYSGKPCIKKLYGSQRDEELDDEETDDDSAAI